MTWGTQQNLLYLHF